MEKREINPIAFRCNYCNHIFATRHNHPRLVGKLTSLAIISDYTDHIKECEKKVLEGIFGKHVWVEL